MVIGFTQQRYATLTLRYSVIQLEVKPKPLALVVFPLFASVVLFARGFVSMYFVVELRDYLCCGFMGLHLQACDTNVRLHTFRYKQKRKISSTH